jgi:hypothetical protein
MQYALLIYVDPGSYDGLSAEEQERITDEYMAIRTSEGTLSGGRLQPEHTATVVRVADGTALTTDGPFADTKESFGGYFVIEAPDLDAALAVAARIPAARMGGGVEVRPLVEYES